MTFTPRTAIFLMLIVATGCASQQRADQAAAAKRQMVGMSREQVLACMGPARKKASEGATEVWSYLSTDYHGASVGGGATAGGLFSTASSHDRSYCTVNIVMKGGVVQVVNYNGPTSSTLFASNEQCGYAVANCAGPSVQE